MPGEFEKNRRAFQFKEEENTMKNERLEEALNQLDSDTYALKNLIETFRRAALWSQENPDADGLDWILAIDTLEEAVNRMGANTSNVFGLSMQDKNNQAPKNTAAAKDAVDLIRKEISKVGDLITIFYAASIQDAEGGAPQLDWPAGFEALSDMVTRIEKANQDVWKVYYPQYRPAKP